MMANWDFNRGPYDLIDKETAAQLHQENITLRHRAFIAAKLERRKIADWLVQCGLDDLGAEVRDG